MLSLLPLNSRPLTSLGTLGNPALPAARSSRAAVLRVRAGASGRAGPRCLQEFHKVKTSFYDTKTLFAFSHSDLLIVYSGFSEGCAMLLMVLL